MAAVLGALVAADSAVFTSAWAALLILLVLSLVFHRNFFALLGVGGGGTAPTVVSRPDPDRDAKEQPEVQFVTFVLNDTQKTWQEILPEQGVPYRHAKLVLFRNATFSGCGRAQSASGPFYCPVDEKVYIDLAFYDELQQRFGAPGQFAQAYVLAHEMGHHVQKAAGHRRQGTCSGRAESRISQRIISEAGIAGRLPGRSVGTLHRRKKAAGSR